MKSRGLQALLVCSLVLNVFAVGAMAGAVIMWKRDGVERPMQGAGQPARLRQAGANLSLEYRRQLRRALSESARELRPDIDASRAARVDARRLLTAPDFDSEAFGKALEEARRADLAIRSTIESRLAELATELPLQERVALAQALERPRRNRNPVNRAPEVQP